MIDLHMHSKFSCDGEYSVSELISQCRAAGLKAVSITDHNIAKANQEAIQLAAAAGMLYIPGIEIDCTFGTINCHVLGYGIDYDSPDFAAIERGIARQCGEASRLRLKLTQELGFDIKAEELQALSKDSYWPDYWTGEMFADVLLSKPEYANHPLFAPYRPGGSRSDNPPANFYWDFYAQGKSCHAPAVYPAMADIVDIIHKNHGKTVLAHPGVNLKRHPEALGPILDLGFDGIEAFSSYHTGEQAQYFYQQARERGLLATCGSDYHGSIKPSIPLGGHNSTLNEAEQDQLLHSLSGK